MSATHLTDAELADFAKGLKQHEIKSVASILWDQLNAPIFVGDRKDRLRIYEAVEAEAARRGQRVAKVSQTIRERAR